MARAAPGRSEQNTLFAASNRPPSIGSITCSRKQLWARVVQVILGRGGFFPCGEQRFFFEVLQ
jgi:hypothetical protein